MGLVFNSGQWIDVIEHVEDDNKQVVWKFERQGNEIKHGAKLIVRPGQAAVFVTRGQLADVFEPGHYSLKTRNMPILSTLLALPFGFNSPIKSDVFFVNTTQFFGIKWETGSPILRRDSEMGMVRISAKGSFAFQVTNPRLFLEALYGARRMDNTDDIIHYLSSFIGEAVSQCIGDMRVSVLDLAMNFRGMSEVVSQYADEKAAKLGISIPEAVIENIILPKEVEKLIDEQSGIGLASRNMEAFTQYQTVRAMRDAAQQKGGLAGLGTSFALGNRIAQTATGTAEKSVSERLREVKRLLDEGVITPDDYELMKRRIIGGDEGSADTRPPMAASRRTSDAAPDTSPAKPPRAAGFVSPAPALTTNAHTAPPKAARTAPPVAPSPASAYPTPKKRRGGGMNSPASAYEKGANVLFAGLSWTVMQMTGPTHALIVCNEIVAKAPYHPQAGNVSWENCGLRKWLNEDFLSTWFKGSERLAIMTNFIRPEASGFGDVDPGRPTQDAIFCLGAREYTKNVPADLTEPYWLRSPGRSAAEVAVVTPQGRITSKNASDATIGVRPALWLELSAL